jgi:hypothetical protein
MSRDIKDKPVYGKELQIPLKVIIEAVNEGNSFLVHVDMPRSPELDIALHVFVRNFADSLLQKESKAPKAERQLTRQERANVASTIAYCDMVVNTQAPILYRDLKLEAAAIETKKEGKSKIVIASKHTEV